MKQIILKYEFLLLIIAIIWAFFFSYVLQLHAGFSTEGDDGSYLLASRKLYLFHEVDDIRPMVISLILGFPYFFGGTDSIVIKWGILINFCCWYSSVLLLFYSISEKLNRKKGFLFSLLFLFCVGNLALAFNFLSESVFVFAILWVAYLINKYTITKQPFYLTITISILILAMLIKPMSIGLLFIIFIFFGSKNKEVCSNKYAVFILISLSMLFFQMYSLKKQYGDFTISYVDSFTYYNFLGARADCLNRDIKYVPGKNYRSEYFIQFSNHKQRKIANDDLLYQLQYNTVNLFKSFLNCIFINASNGSNIVNSCENVNQTSYFNFFHFLFKALSKIQNIIFSTIGVLLSFYCLIKKRKDGVFSVIIAMMLLYIIFVSAISCDQGDRFHIVFYPLAVLLIAKFIKNKTDVKHFSVLLQK